MSAVRERELALVGGAIGAGDTLEVVGRIAAHGAGAHLLGTLVATAYTGVDRAGLGCAAPSRWPSGSAVWHSRSPRGEPARLLNKTDASNGDQRWT